MYHNDTQRRHYALYLGLVIFASNFLQGIINNIGLKSNISHGQKTEYFRIII